MYLHLIEAKSSESSSDNDLLFKEANNKRYIRIQKNLKNYMEILNQ